MKNALRHIGVRNLLSFGDVPAGLPLGALNTLIGANGSGKSNLIHVMGLLETVPERVDQGLEDTGGITKWLRRGDLGRVAAITIDVAVGEQTFQYEFSFRDRGDKAGPAITVVQEALTRGDGAVLMRMNGLEPKVKLRDPDGNEHEVDLSSYDTSRTLLAQIKDPDGFPEHTAIGRFLDSFRVYRRWNFGWYTSPRFPQPSGLRNDFLDEDFRNLGHVLGELKNSDCWNLYLHRLQVFYTKTKEVLVKDDGDTVQILLKEEDYNVPGIRLSDGTLRWLVLLAILMDPEPPPLVCIEEPELGLHPDMLPPLAEVLIEASERMQLIVTTHSPDLLSALPLESIVICDKHGEATQFDRPGKEKFEAWIKGYKTVPAAWASGAFPGASV